MNVRNKAFDRARNERLESKAIHRMVRETERCKLVNTLDGTFAAAPNVRWRRQLKHEVSRQMSFTLSTFFAFPPAWFISSLGIGQMLSGLSVSRTCEA